MTHLLVWVRLALLAGSTLSPAIVPRTASAEPPPNVLIIVTDDQRDGTLNLMPRTARFFRAAGRVFPHSFVTTPLCCPSRSSIFTGLYAHNHGVLTNGEHSLPQALTVQRYLHGGGYETAMVGKYLNSWPLAQRPPHFDRWAVSEANVYSNPEFNVDGKLKHLRGYSTDIISSRANHLIRSFEARDAQPWFLYVAPVAPHLPSTPAPEYADAPVPGWDRDPAVLEADRSDKPPWVQASTTSAGWIEWKRADQLRTLRSVDDLVGGIAQTLRRNQEGRRTIALFISDNGFLWGEHGLTRKDQPYTPSISVPLLLRWPGHVVPGSRDERFATNVDLAPTIMDAAGLTPAAAMDGHSLLQSRTRKHLFTEFFHPGLRPGVPGWASIRTHRFQYVEYYNRARSRVIFREFYRLDRDPWQLTNVLHDGNHANNPDLTALHRALRRDRACAGSACP